MQCTNCKSEKTIKKGWVATRKRGKKVQRYFCKDCGKMFTSRQNLPTYRERRPDLNERVKHLYVEGMPLRAIGRVLGCDYNTVVNKFKKYALADIKANHREREQGHEIATGVCSNTLHSSSWLGS